MSGAAMRGGLRARLSTASVALSAVTAIACQQSANTLAPRTFNRPVQATLVCLETATGVPRPLTDCALNSANVSPTGLAMHGLVLQEARGEVAAVDLVARTVIDSDRSVPGYTFVAVDPLPTAIVVPELAPECAFVASAGADVIDVIDLRIFRREGASTAVVREPYELPGAPTAMVLSPAEDAIWVAMPERSSVGRIPVVGCELGALEEISLDAAIPAGITASAEGDLGRYCPLDFGFAPPAAVDARVFEPADLVARPAVLAVGRELLVGDRALPLVHRIDLDSGAVLAPLSVGAPIRALAVTPEVPDAYDATSADRSRFVYAIDDQDGTVMAIEYSDPGAPSFGAVIGVGADSSERPDRMPFLVGARTLEVLEPRFDEAEPFTNLCDPTNVDDERAAPSHSTLRGVFLAVGMTDATVRFVDVFDLDAPCRGWSTGAVSDCSSSTEPFVYIRRHRPRIGERRATIGASASDVSFVVNGATLRLAPEGGSTSATLDEIDCAVDASGLAPIFATDDARAAGRGRVCGQVDPFAATPEIWSAAWQGALSGTASSTGNFTALPDGTVALDARVDFCAAGALGSDDLAAVPAGEPEAAFVGDVVAITTTLPEATSADERCQAVTGIEGSRQLPRPVLLPIRSASTRPADLRDPYRGRIVLDADAPVLDRTIPLTLADVLRCFGDQLVRFDVRTRASFSVISSRTGQRHRVVRGDDGTCEVDTSLARSRVARALPGQTYANGLVGFRIPSVPSADATDLRITVGNVPVTLNIDIGALASSTSGRGLALPSDIVWSSVYQRMYIVDVERRGLVELTTEPLQYTQSRFE